MALKISEIGKLLKTANRFQSIEFNTTLPAKIEVKEKLNDIKYLIKLGKKEVITKSFVPLKKGKYFAIVKEIGNTLKISDLKPIPKMAILLDKIKLKDKFITKEHILTHLSNASNKEEFLFFTNILIAMQQKKIYHLIINEKKKSILQYKYSKNRLKFYAVFNNLGEIEGEIYNNNLDIYSPYKNTVALIKKYSHLIGFNLNIFIKDTKPLYEFNNSLLNLKA